MDTDTDADTDTETGDKRQETSRDDICYTSGPRAAGKQGQRQGRVDQRYSKETRDARGDATVGESQGQGQSEGAQAEVRESDESKRDRESRDLECYIGRRREDVGDTVDGRACVWFDAR